MASSNLLFESSGQLLLEDDSLFQLTAEFDEADPVPEVVSDVVFGGRKQIHKQAIPMSIRVQIRSKLYVKNTVKINILSKLQAINRINVPIISPLITSVKSKLNLESKLQVKQKESISIKGQQSYKEFYRTIQQLEEMI